MRYPSPCFLRGFALLLTCPLVSGAMSAQWLEPDARQLASANGKTNGDLFGWRVRRVDDVNGDGRQDFAVAAPFHLANRGRVSVHSGKDGRELWSVSSATGSTILGFSLETIDDVDNDGIRDVLIGEPFGQFSGGFVHLHSGKNGRWITTFAGTSRFDSVGFSIAADGDYDGDGSPDIATGATSFEIAVNSSNGVLPTHSRRSLLRSTGRSASPESVGMFEVSVIWLLYTF